MGSQLWTASDFLGLTPAVDPRRSDKFFALEGENYAFDAIGPKSQFGNRFLTPYPLGSGKHVQGFRLHLTDGDRCFTIIGDSILEWREDLGGWKVIYITPDTSASAFRWTAAYLNGIQYFCNPRVGIIAYVLESGFCAPLDAPGSPQFAVAITVNNGVLCCMTNTRMQWSASSDGTDWIPRIGGPGFQLLSDKVSGTPVMISSYAKGVLVWTTGGVMRSEFSGDVDVFRHRAVNTEYRPINSFCVCQLDDNTVVILDERGLFQSNGELPTPYSPVFNEFLIQYIQDNQLKYGVNIRLEWDSLRRQMYVSTSLNPEDDLYDTAFVLYPAIDKWGTFNESHFGILPVLIQRSQRSGDFFGFVGADRRLRYWESSPSREILPSNPSLDSIYPLIQKSPYQNTKDSVLLMPSSAKVSTVTPGVTSHLAGFYAYDGGLPVPPSIKGLSSRIRLGLIKIPTGDSYDQLVEIINIMLGTGRSGPDANAKIGFELDWGAYGDGLFSPEDIDFVDCELEIFGSLDGGTISDSMIPEIIRLDRDGKHYSCSITGIWHIIELKAQDIGQKFHLRSLQVTGVYAGKYS